MTRHTLRPMIEALEVRQLLSLTGDLNGDGSVSIADFIILASNFNSPGDWSKGDLNGDGLVTISDFIDLASNFGTTYSGVSWPVSAEDSAMLSQFASSAGT